MRNPDYQFVNTDTDVIIAAMISAYEKITGVSVRPASPEKLFIQWVADVIVQERVLNNYTGNQNLPSRAEGENLNSLGQLFFDSERPEAQPAVCTERFFISEEQNTSILVPGGTKVTDASGALVWETTSDAYIPIGSLFTDIAICCQTAGIVGNGYALGQINSLIDVNNIAYYDRCENITVSDKGADRASDDEYYALMRESEDGYSTAGARGGYIYHARKVSTEIADIVANSPADACVYIYVLMKDGTIAGEEMKKAVLEACNPDSIRPLTDHVLVDDPETVAYNINLTYYMPEGLQRSSATIECAVQEAVENYVAWQCGKLGRDINPDELRQSIKETGIKRIVLSEPLFTVLRDGRDDTVPQVASVGTVNIINGGYEDE